MGPCVQRCHACGFDETLVSVGSTVKMQLRQKPLTHEVALFFLRNLLFKGLLSITGWPSDER